MEDELIECGYDCIPECPKKLQNDYVKKCLKKGLQLCTSGIGFIYMLMKYKSQTYFKLLIDAYHSTSSGNINNKEISVRHTK